MKRALITGVSGFVGSHLAEYLLVNTDWAIIGMMRWRSPLDNLEHLVLNEGSRVHFVYADLNDSESLKRAVEFAAPDYVFHLAAQSYPATSFGSPTDTIETNTNGTVRLLEALKSYVPYALIHVCSSSEVYGRVPREMVPINESCRFHPASPYAISKVGADLVAQHYAQAHDPRLAGPMNVLVTRMFTHTGPRRGDVFAESSFAKQIAMIEAGLADRVYHGNLDSLRTIADVRDAVRAYHMLLTVNPQRGAVYNIGGNHTCTVGQVLDDLCALADRPIRRELDPRRVRPLDADLQVPDCTKFKEVTGWEPKIPYSQTLKELLDYWRKKVARGDVTLPR